MTRQLTLGLGTIVTDHYGPKNPDGFGELLSFAAKAGIATLDTAAAYGHGESELFLGKWLERLGLDFAICTKIGLAERGTNADGTARYRPDAKADSLWRQAEQSLKRLRRDHVDTLMLHHPDPQVPIEQAMETLAAIRDAGLARKIGFSNLSDADAERAFAQGIVQIVQYPWSLLDSRRAALLRKAGDAGVERMVFGALAFGILAGSVDHDTKFEEEDWRGVARSGTDPGTMGAPLFMDDVFDRAMDRTTRFAAAGRAAGLDLAAATIAASLAVAPAEQVIVGCRSWQELRDLVAGIGRDLPDAMLRDARALAVI